MTRCDIAIIGAGPYGLSAAAHLRQIDGLAIKVFGRPMSFWANNMPSGMLLRSPWIASHISDPGRTLTLDAFRTATGKQFSKPVPLARFVEYGRWFQQQVAADLDERWITEVASTPGGFRLSLEDGNEMIATRVIVAAGIEPFPHRPRQFHDLPRQLTSHTSEHKDFGVFSGKRMLVVGSGQSALESAALLHEQGTEVEIVTRAPALRFLQKRSWLHKWPLEPVLYAWPDVGPAGLSHLVANPSSFNKLPRSWQNRLAARAIRPAGAAWLGPRLNNVRTNIGRSITSAVARSGKVSVTLDDGSTREVDHVLLGTGYRVHLSGYKFLSSELLRSIRQTDGYPHLKRGFEASVAGLHFLGAPAAWSFGPLMRFVAGTEFAGPRLARRVRDAVRSGR
jgi:lysine/ornithine N-monooxygenase